MPVIEMRPFAVDSGKEREPPSVLLAAEDRDRSGLRHRLDDENAGHDRPPRKVAREVPLVRPHAFASHHAAARLQFDHLVDQEKGVAMRQDIFDLSA